ncbi:uncharacterized protein SPAPADRAFT_60477 [Spathaspora passalidarum NRRL Y-27907]|uniref:Uncharacterized protein n=1 Tax=Spathaspora passalidarum (strain NRRL Y-27907 / 11-Y1) TaxID=619300 RepID=G3ALC7_SPAPN|nr:uncharacterized protein SPAPADRAFT_60477 [Spathaspora passalidarum NRRL Y-27907]EGW33170.1 hypothetical protein SPAPADRAFT_60477 [Spathaspora passalidarum NRRL Y-27907]
MSSLGSPIPDDIPLRSPLRLKNRCYGGQWGMNMLNARIQNKHRQQESITSISTFDSMNSDSSFEMPSGSSSIFSVDRSSHKINDLDNNDNDKEQEEEEEEEDTEFLDAIADAEIYSIDGIETIVGVYCLSATEFEHNRNITRLSYVEI